jgi:hypothetical protein
MSRITRTLQFAMPLLATLALGITVLCTAAADMHSHTTTPFTGAKVNGGTVTHGVVNNQDVLTLSEDFIAPDTPAPHWQIVDSKGNAYLLQRLMVKGDNGDVLTRSIVVPSYIKDIANVQIWCAWAETLLGETSFGKTITLNSATVSGTMKSHTTSQFQGVKANTGTCTHTCGTNGKCLLTLSDDFKIPDAPAPHWQLVDSQGNVYLLQRLDIKDNKVNRSITVPSYVPDVATVQIWCAYAQVLLGEASFERPVK